MSDENNLTVTEKNYINKNKSNLIDINILNDANIFGNAGKGVFYDYISYLEKEYNLSFNKMTNSESASSLALTKGDSVPSNAKKIYEDHYVLVRKDYVNTNSSTINGIIGVLNNKLDVVNKYLGSNKTYKTYDDKNSLFMGLINDEVTYIAVPMIEYMDSILDNLYSIVYHVSDLKEYYYINGSDNDILNSLIYKTYNVWSRDNFNNSFNKSEYELFVDKLKITEKELDIINNKKYTYGFVENAPYEINAGGSYGGIVAEYIASFEDFANLTIDTKEYKNVDKLKNEINRGNISIYTDFYNIGVLNAINNGINAKISVIMNNDDKRVYTNISSLSGIEVYIKSNSMLKSYLEGYGVIVKTYDKDKDIRKLTNKNGIVMMDYPEYLIYARNDKTVSERFRIDTNVIYSFRTNTDTMFNRLFTYYISTKDYNSVVYTGISMYDRTTTSGKLISRITKYALLLIAVIVGGAYIIHKLSKKIHIKKKIKKADKMKYIDVLTSLKNRNFLNENIPIWNRNTIYPQSIILINLNGIQEINDSYGYTEGDKQIQCFANILIKTQLDNTEIMRTDGNEFVIYMLGYSEKQVLSYIKKLNKEIKSLPYDKGAAMGFSMILDDVKLIDDAINEATEVMKNNKVLMGKKNEEQIKEI